MKNDAIKKDGKYQYAGAICTQSKIMDGGNSKHPQGVKTQISGEASVKQGHEYKTIDKQRHGKPVHIKSSYQTYIRHKG